MKGAAWGRGRGGERGAGVRSTQLGCTPVGHKAMFSPGQGWRTGEKGQSSLNKRGSGEGRDTSFFCALQHDGLSR